MTIFVNVLRHVNHSSRLPRASSDWFPSFVFTSQALLPPIYWRIGVHADDGDEDDDVSGVQFYSYGIMAIIVLVLVLVLPYLIQQ